MKTEILARKLSEIDFFNGQKVEEGHYLHISSEKRDAFLKNPFRNGEDLVCQWVGYVDDKPAGYNYSFPIEVYADGKIYGSTTGSSLNVEEWARKSDLGLILPAKGVEQTSKDGIAMTAACSQMAIPLHQINGYKYFFFPRYIALWKSRSVVETLVPGMLAKGLSPIADLFIGCYKLIVCLIARAALRGYEVVPVASNDGAGITAIANIIREDKHRFRENHDERWLKWHIECSFSKHGPCTGYLLRNKTNGAVVAFALTKRRFYENASHRGFRNIWLGSFQDWGWRKGFEKPGRWMLVRLSVEMAKNCDAVDLSADDVELQSLARKLCWQQVGDANVGVKVMAKFPLFKDKAIKEQSNWRIRPGMGDNALS